MNFQYAITAKKTRKPITQQHYLDYLDYLTDLGKVGNVNFEDTRGLHTHFILQTTSKLDFNKLKPTKYGWNVKAIPIYNRKGWIKYCRKDNLKMQAVNAVIKDTYEDDDTEIDLPQSPTIILKKRILPYSWEL